MMWPWYQSCLVLAIVLAHEDDTTCDNTALMQQRRPTSNIALTEQSLHELAPYDGDCKPSSRPFENDEPHIAKDAISAGMEDVLLMNIAYGLAGDDSVFSGDDLLSMNTRRVHDSLTSVTKSRAKPGPGAFGFAAKLDGQLVISMAGTKDTADAWADLKSIMAVEIDLGGKNYSAGDGFVSFYEEIRKGLQHVFEDELKTPGTLVTVVGHSLGGAIANLAAVDLANRYQARIRLVTAGSPRVFGYWSKGAGTLENSAKSVQTELIVDGVSTKSAQIGFCQEPPSTAGKICTQRWVNNVDGVPTMPGCGAGYFHIGNGGFLINQLNCYSPGQNALTGTPQHQDYTPYTLALNHPFANHGIAPYYERMNYAKLGQTVKGKEPNCWV